MALCAFSLAWVENGSIDATDWIPYALVIALLLTIVLAWGLGRIPMRLAIGGITGLAGFAVWQALSIAWAPTPSLARDDALLTVFYVLVCTLGAVTLVRGFERAAATALVAAAAGALGVAATFHVIGGHELGAALPGGRLYFPIDYANAQAAAFLVGFWPAILLAGRRASPILLRAAAVGCGSLLLAGWLFTQSKGGGIALAVSAVVVFAVSPARLRLAVPVALAAIPAGLGFSRLVAAYHEAPGTPAFAHAAHRAGWTVLIVGAVGAGLGALYAFADRQVDPGPGARRVAGVLAAVLVVVAIAGSGVGFLASVDHPRSWLGDKWHAFKHQPRTETSSSHFLTIGSNRYDFWRVALHQFVEHPIAGIGDRGFDVVYLQHSRSNETPARAHSFEMDALSEDGIVGFLLLFGSLGCLLVVAWRGTRRRGLTATAALGTGAYFVAHSTVDWIWSFPAVGLPVFLLLGAAGAGDIRRAIRPRVALSLAIASVVIAVLLLAPPWLSARYTTQAVEGSSTASDLRWARRLDPLSTDPYVTQSVLATTPAGAISPLERAIRKERRSVGLDYMLAQAYERAGRKADARRMLLIAQQLDPTDRSYTAEANRLSGTGG